MTTEEQIESFYRFAMQQLEKRTSYLTMDELFDAWRYQGLSENELSESVAAIQAVLDDMNGGDKGRDIKEVIQEIRGCLNLSPAD